MVEFAPSGSRLAAVALIGQGRPSHLCPPESPGLAAFSDIADPNACFIHRGLTTGLEPYLKACQTGAADTENG